MSKKRGRNFFRDLIKRPKSINASASQPNSSSPSHNLVPGNDAGSVVDPTVSSLITPFQSASSVDLCDSSVGQGHGGETNGTSTPISSFSGPALCASGSIFPDELSPDRQVQGSYSKSTTKDILAIAWIGTEMLLKKVEGCLGGTLAKTPVAAFNAIINIKNAIKDNKGAIEELVIQTAERLLAVNKVVDEHIPDSAKPRMTAFAGILRNEIHSLGKMASKGTLRQLLENEADKSAIDGIFKRINEATKTFQLDISWTTERQVNVILSEIKLMQLERIRARKAIYNADLGTGATVTREPCTKDTREEILKDIITWADSANSPPVFWLTGQAGSGKTTIAYTIAQCFDRREKEKHTGRHTILGGNFFCSRQFEETRRQICIIPTLVYQLARKSRSYAHALHELDNFDSVDKLTEQMEDLLIGPWLKSEPRRHTELPPYLLIVDALDEIEGFGGSTFLQSVLETINRRPLRGLKFLITSRPDPHVVKLCKSFSSKAVCRLQDVPVEHVESDIIKYLHVKLPNFAGTPELKTVAKLADGLFIAAATIVRYLTPRPLMTADEQCKLLSKLRVSFSASCTRRPLLIDELYQQILRDAFSGLDDDLLESRLRILHTFLCTFERTSTSLAAALISESDATATTVLSELYAVLYCKDDQVLWYHASFPDFIFNQTRSTFELDGRRISMSIKPHHHALLATCCFDVMLKLLRFNIGDIRSSFILDDEDPGLTQRVDTNINGILRYASRHWAHHLALTDETEVDDKSNLCDCIADFLRIRILFWIEAMNLLRSSGQCTRILQSARGWVLKNAKGKSELAADIAEATNFATYFTANPPASSTPHLYISTLATWLTGSTLSQRWREQFPHIPSFTHSRRATDLPLMTVPTGGFYNYVACSADGTHIVSGSTDESLQLWDASTGAKLKVLNGHTDSIFSVAFSADSTRIVSGSRDNSVRVWDASTGATLKVLNGHTNLIISVAFSADSTRIVSGSHDRSIRVWDASTGAELMVLNGHTSYVRSVVFSADGTRIVSGSDDQSVRVWDVSTGAVLMVLNCQPYDVHSVTFSANSTRIVSACSHNKSARVAVWDALTGAELKVVDHDLHSDHNSFGFSADTTRIVAGSYGLVRVWDTSTGDELKVLRIRTPHAVSLAFAADGTRIVSGLDDKYVQVWDASTGAELKVPNGHAGWVYTVAYSADGMRIVSGSSDDSVRVWDASTGAELKVLNGHTDCVRSVAFSADGSKIVSGSDDRSVRVWDAWTGAELKVLNGHTDSVSSVALSTDCTRIVSGSGDKSVRVWDASTGVELKVLRVEKNYANGQLGILSVAFSADGMLIVSGSSDQSVRVWDASTGAELKVLNGHTDHVWAVAFSADGTKIVSGSSDRSVRVWDASTGAELKVLNSHTLDVRSVAFSADGTRIVSGALGSSKYIHSTSLRLWDASTGAELKALHSHTEDIFSVAFSPDGNRIVSGSSGGVWVWDASTEAKPAAPKFHVHSADSIASPADSTCITLEEKAAQSYIVGRAYPAWVNDTKTGWTHSVLDGYRLMWVPEQAYPYSIIIISRYYGAFINFRDCKIGHDWAGCYANHHI